MKYCDLCNAFYINTTAGGLKDYTSQAKISEYLIRWAISREEDFDKLPASQSSYDKWFSGETSPKKAVWSAVKLLDEKDYSSKLINAFDKKNIGRVASKLGVKLNAGENIDERRLALSITRIMYDMADGKGVTEKCVLDYYTGLEEQGDFSDYISAKRSRYSVMKLLGGGEVNLEDYFVCNTIGDKRRVGFDKGISKGNFIEDATLKKIRDMYQKRGLDNRKVVLLGSGGSGKTLMMQHIFLEALDDFAVSGILPVFLELRYFTQETTINGFIANALNVSDDSYDEDKVHSLLQAGKLHVLLDGLDEIDPSDIDDFHNKLTAFAEKYKKVQIVVASRDCDAKNGLKRFMPLYVWPFDTDQSLALIDKILAVDGNMKARPEIKNYLEHGFIKKNGVFASHPMMLTFVAVNYPKFKEFNKSHLLFYKRAYEAMLTGHDDNKKPYDRVFRCVDNAEDFTKVFAEFCAKSYEQGIHEFDIESFEVYFGKLTSYHNFENTHKMNIKNFKQDACSTACMMYEEEEKVLYIDPGFQKYLFADYYIKNSSDETRAMGEALLNVNRSAFDDFEAFDMMYAREPLKFEICVLLPFLQYIYKENNKKEAFRRYLTAGYDNVLYTYVDGNMINKVTGEICSVYDLGIANFNEPRTIILDYLFEKLDRKRTAVYVSSHQGVCIDGMTFTSVYGRYEIDGKNKSFSLSSFYSDKVMRETFGSRSYEYIVDANSEPVILGHTYELDTLLIQDHPEKYDKLIDAMIDEESEFYLDFIQIESFYKNLEHKQRRNKIY